MKLLPVLLVSVGMTGCIFGGKQAAKVTAPTSAPSGPHPRGPEPAPPPPKPSPEAGVLAVTPPPLDQSPGVNAPDLEPITPTIPPAKPVAQPPRRASRPRTPQPTPPAATPPDQVATPALAPQLGEILTDAQRRQVQTELVDHLTRARDVLTRASRATLSSDQVETRERIRIFIQQAESARDRDAATALQLARRADLLAQDLLPALH
jgi:hypothetical protein